MIIRIVFVLINNFEKNGFIVRTYSKFIQTITNSIYTNSYPSFVYCFLPIRFVTNYFKSTQNIITVEHKTTARKQLRRRSTKTY